MTAAADHDATLAVVMFVVVLVVVGIAMTSVVLQSPSSGAVRESLTAAPTPAPVPGPSGPITSGLVVGNTSSLVCVSGCVFDGFPQYGISIAPPASAGTTQVKIAGCAFNACSKGAVSDPAKVSTVV